MVSLITKTLLKIKNYLNCYSKKHTFINLTNKVDISFWSDDLQKERGIFASHHPIFNNFALLDKDILYSEYLKEHKQLDLSINEEYFEWIDILMSIKDSNNGSYHFVELGSGFGRWGVRAIINARYNKNINNFYVEFAEAEPHHVKMNLEHCKINNINNFKLYDGLVSDHNGEDLFYINQPNGNIEDISIKWWGQAKVHDYEKITKEIGTYQNKIVYLLASGYQAISVKTYDIEEISNSWKLVDLVDLDVQGEEFLILNRSIKNFNNKVKRIHIGTHSVDVEKKIFKLLKDNKWINVRNYSCLKVNNTIFGDIDFTDGVQSWINPRFDVTYG
jgi:FkbM family methyltransferase